jgi:hypothetical protein
MQKGGCRDLRGIRPLREFVCPWTGLLGLLGLSFLVFFGLLGFEIGDVVAIVVCNGRIVIAKEMAFAFAGRERDQGHEGVFAHELGRSLGVAHGDEILFDPLHERHAQLFVRHFASAELKQTAHLVPLLEEFFGVPEFRVVIVLVDVHTELDFLHFGRRVRFPVFLVLGKFIFELAEVDDATDRRIGGCGDLDKVQTVLLGGPQGVLDFHDPELLPGGRDNHAHLARANALVDSNLIELDGDFKVRTASAELRAGLTGFVSPSPVQGVQPTARRLLLFTLATVRGRMQL